MNKTPWCYRNCVCLPVVLLLLLAAGAGKAGTPDALERGPERPVEVIFAAPRGSVERLESIDVVFSKPMAASEEGGSKGKPYPLVIDPPIRGSVSWIGGRALHFVPQADLPAGTRLVCRIPQGTRSIAGEALASASVWEIVIDGIPPAAGAIDSLETQVTTLRTSGPPRIESVAADVDGITLRLTAPVDAEAVLPYLTLEPAVADLVVRNRARSELRLSGDFRGSTTYTLRLRPGLPSQDDAVLETEEAASVTTPHLAPRLSILHSYGILQERLDAAIRIEGVNLDTVTVFAAWVPGDSLPARLLAGPDSWRTVELPLFAQWHSPRQAPDSIHRLEIPLEQLGRPDGEARILQIRAQGRALYPQQRTYRLLHAEGLIQITDLGLSVFTGARHGLAWVASLGSGDAMEGVEVRLRAPGAGEPLWSGTSSDAGLLWLPGIDELPLGADEPLFAEARTGRDAVWLRLGEGKLSNEQRYRGYLTTDRPSYRPGESVRWVACARKAGPEGIVPIDLPVIGYTITAARSGRLIVRGSLGLKPPGDGAATFKIDTEERPGTYRISLTESPDGSGEPFAGGTFSIAADPGFEDPAGSPFAGTKIRMPLSGTVGAGLDRCSALELNVDQRSYIPGDTARIRISPPMDRCEALVLMFDRDIRQVHRIAPLHGPVTLPIPLVDVTPPKISVRALLAGPASTPVMTPEDRPVPSFVCGKNDLPIRSDPWELDVDLTTEREVYERGEEVTLHIAVLDAQGNPAPGTATIMVVQEALLDSAVTLDSSPLAAIFSAGGPEVSYADTRAPLQSALPGEKQSAARREAGGGMPERTDRKRPGTTAYFEAFRPIGPDGKATIRFAPAAREPYCRVRVLACSGPDRFGYGESLFEVRSALDLECAAPRFVYEGDEIEIRATVRSNLDEKTAVEIEAEVEGAAIDGKNRRKIKVKPGEDAGARFRLIDPKPEGITLRIHARSKERRDSVEITIPVRRDVVWDRSFLSGAVNPSMRTDVEIPDGVLPGIGGLTTFISPSILGGLEETLATVIDGRDRSFEELAASLLAVATRARLLDHFNLPDTTDGFDAVRRAALLSEAILDCVGPREIHSWPSLESPPADDSAVAFALYVLVQARERGYPIPQQLFDRIAGEARGRLARMIGNPLEHEPAHRLPEQGVWLLWALSEAGRLAAGSPQPDMPIRAAEVFFSMRAQLPVTSRIPLGLAIADLRHRDDAEDLRRNWAALSAVLADEIKEGGLQRAGHTAWIAAPEAGSHGVDANDVLSTALFLRFLSLYDPGDRDLPGMISWILSRRGPATGSWWNSRTTAWTADLLVSAISGIEGPATAVSGQIALGEEFESFHFQGWDRRGERRFLPMDRLIRTEGGTATHPLRIETDGRRSVYFTATIDRAHPGLDMPARGEGLFLERTYLDAGGRPFKKEIPLGDLLFARVMIIVPQDAKSLFVEDRLPAGIALPERRRFFTARSMTGLPGREIESDLNVVHVEVTDGGIRFYAEDVPAGSYSIRYPAIAAIEGSFHVPGARAGLLEDREVYAISSPLSVRIKDRR